MINIDQIMNLIDWNKSAAEQLKGIKMAEKVENINVFLRPCNKNYNKNVWENCAKILSKRTDEELSPYLMELLEWLQDLNWPGGFCVLERLQKYADDASFNLALETSFKYAKALEDDVWNNNLSMLKKEKC